MRGSADALMIRLVMRIEHSSIGHQWFNTRHLSTFLDRMMFDIGERIMFAFVECHSKDVCYWGVSNDVCYRGVSSELCLLSGNVIRMMFDVV